MRIILWETLSETTKVTLWKVLMELYWKWKLLAGAIELIMNKKIFSDCFSIGHTLYFCLRAFTCPSGVQLNLRSLMQLNATKSALPIGPKPKCRSDGETTEFFYCTSFWKIGHGKINVPFFILEMCIFLHFSFTFKIVLEHWHLCSFL